MKYICLVYQDEEKLDALTESEYNALVGELLEYRKYLCKSGQSIAADPLQSVQTAMTVRVRIGKVFITEGPFAETKEQLSGFYLINARDLNDAIRMAAKIPSARLGCIEVRPIQELNLP